MLPATSKPKLLVGFAGETLSELLGRFNVQCVLSVDAASTLDWHALHGLQIENRTPVTPAVQFGSFYSITWT